MKLDTGGEYLLFKVKTASWLLSFHFVMTLSSVTNMETANKKLFPSYSCGAISECMNVTISGTSHQNYLQHSQVATYFIELLLSCDFENIITSIFLR